jgi:hypothetical protein
VVALKLGKVNERVTGRLTLRTAKKLKISPRKMVTLAKSSFFGAEGKTITVKVRLSATNRRLLKKLRSVRVKATMALKDAAGNTSVRTYRFTLKAPRRRGAAIRASRRLRTTILTGRTASGTRSLVLARGAEPALTRSQ